MDLHINHFEWQLVVLPFLNCRRQLEELLCVRGSEDLEHAASHSRQAMAVSTAVTTHMAILLRSGHGEQAHANAGLAPSEPALLKSDEEQRLEKLGDLPSQYQPTESDSQIGVQEAAAANAHRSREKDAVEKPRAGGGQDLWISALEYRSRTGIYIIVLLPLCTNTILPCFFGLCTECLAITPTMPSSIHESALNSERCF